MSCSSKRTTARPSLPRPPDAWSCTCAGPEQQYSTHLAAQGSSSPALGDLLAYIADHPAADLSVIALAERANMTQRSFQRLFTREIGTSPGKYVEQTRMDAARRLLEQTDDGLARAIRRAVGQDI